MTYICIIEKQKDMKTNKKLREMTDEELDQLSKYEILEKSFNETIDEINLDTEYIGDGIKHFIGSLIVSICMIPLVSISSLFLLSFLVPVFFVYAVNNLIKHRKFNVSLLRMEHKMYSESGKFSQDLLDSYLNKVDLTIKL